MIIDQNLWGRDLVLGTCQCHSVSWGEGDTCCVTWSVEVRAMDVVSLGQLRWGWYMLYHSVSCGEGVTCCVTRSVEVKAMDVVSLGQLRWGRWMLYHSVSWGEGDGCCVTRSVEMRAMHVPTLIFAFLPKIHLMKVRHYASFTCLARTCYISTNALSYSWQQNAGSTACGRVNS
jgi:hypothetical protein